MKTTTIIRAQPGTVFLAVFSQDNLDNTKAVFETVPIIAWCCYSERNCHYLRPLFYDCEPWSAEEFRLGAVLYPMAVCTVRTRNGLNRAKPSSRMCLSVGGSAVRRSAAFKHPRPFSDSNFKTPRRRAKKARRCRVNGRRANRDHCHEHYARARKTTTNDPARCLCAISGRRLHALAFAPWSATRLQHACNTHGGGGNGAPI